MVKAKLNKSIILGIMVAAIAIAAIIVAVIFLNNNGDEVSEETSTEEALEIIEKSCTEKALDGDFSCYAGTYTYTTNGYSETVTFTQDGVFTDGFGLAQAENYRNNGKPTKITDNNGVLVLTYTYYWNDEAWLGVGEHDFEYYLIPGGIEYEADDYGENGIITKSTDTSKARMIDRNRNGVMVLPVYYKD